MGSDVGHAAGYPSGMKTFSLYFLVIALAVVFAAVQPVGAIPEVRAAMAIPGPDIQPTCKTAACLAGWQAALDHAINDEADCRLVSSVHEEAAGCRAFVQEVLQDRLENQW